jgi:hypothetical protein
VNVEDRLDGRVEALHVEGLVDRALSLAQAERVHLRDVPGQLHRLLAQVIQWHHAIDHADLLGLAGRDRPAGEQDLLGLARAQLPGVPVVFHAADAHEDDRVGEFGVLRRDDQVHRPDEQQGAGDGLALDRGDRRLRDVAPAQRVLQVPARLERVDVLERDLVRPWPDAGQVVPAR